MNKNQNTSPPLSNNQPATKPDTPQEALALYTKLKTDIIKLSEKLSILGEKEEWSDAFNDILNTLNAASEEALRQAASPINISTGSYGPYKKNKIKKYTYTFTKSSKPKPVKRNRPIVGWAVDVAESLDIFPSNSISTPYITLSRTKRG